MTNHIVSFSVGIDDDAIIKSIMINAEQQVLYEIKRDVINLLFANKNYYYREVNLSTDGNVNDIAKIELREYAKQILMEVLGDNRHVIIEKAAEMLTDSYKRTRAWKEKAGEVIK